MPNDPDPVTPVTPITPVTPSTSSSKKYLLFAACAAIIILAIFFGARTLTEKQKQKQEQAVAQAVEQERQQAEQERLAREEEIKREQAQRDSIARVEEEIRLQDERDRLAREEEQRRQEDQRRQQQTPTTPPTTTQPAQTPPTQTQPTQTTSQAPNIEMVFVQGGTFTMGCTAEQGSDCSDQEKPAHQVTLRSFNIGKYPVTQAQWEAVMGGNPSAVKGSNLPVTNVSWNDAQEFIRKLNTLSTTQYRLPTEAEWEYAARGGNRRSQDYKYSGSHTVGNVAWYSANSGGIKAVGTKQPNELGIFDMSGNVLEWCSDWYGSYTATDKTNPQGPSSGSFRVLRGGSWSYDFDVHCRVASRFNRVPAGRYDFVGFRLVLP